MFCDAVSQRTILVVNGDTGAADLLAKSLADSGMRADVLQSGDEAVTAVRAIVFDAVLIDWEIPGLPAEATARLIRHHSPDVKIVGVGRVGQAAFRGALEEGAIDAFLETPFDAEAVREAIDWVLGRGRTEGGRVIAAAA